MKPSILLTLIAIFLSVANLSCKKNGSSGPTITVEYRIAPAGDYFGFITYKDDDHDVTSEPWPTGSKTFTIKSKPFLARFTTEFEGRLNSPDNFELMILVNGQIKKTEQGYSSLANTLTFSVEYLIE